jgi:chemotaxis signal transduction protein
MSEGASGLSARAEALRLAFDRGFAEPRRSDTAPMESLIGFSLASEPYALRLSEIGGVFVDRKITRVPSGGAALLGFAGFRGAIVPVYDLRALLGRGASEAPRWLAIASGASVAFAFEVFDGHLRVPSAAVMAREGELQSRRLVREVVSADGLVRPLVHLPSVIETIRNQRPGANAAEER